MFRAVPDVLAIAAVPAGCCCSSRVSHSLGEALQLRFEAVYELGNLGPQIDDPFVTQPPDEIGPRNEERLVARPPHKSQHREQDALDLERVVMRRLPAPELELTQFLH